MRKNNTTNIISLIRSVMILACTAMIINQGLASNVAWNAIEVDDCGDGFYGVHPYPYMTMTGSVVGKTLVLWAEAYDYMELSSSWVLANKGDEVSVEWMQSQGSYFYSADFNETEELGDVQTDYSIDIAKGKSAYLAVISRVCSSPDEYDVGWVELYYGTDGTLIAKSSALDRDGGSLIVGAIPEPTSALLMLIGVTTLLLRRRQRQRGPLRDCQKISIRRDCRQRSKVKGQTAVVLESRWRK